MLLVISTGAHAGSTVSSRLGSPFCFLSYSPALASPVSSTPPQHHPPLTVTDSAPPPDEESASTSHSYFALSDGLCALCEPSYVINSLPCDSFLWINYYICQEGEREECMSRKKNILICFTEYWYNEESGVAPISFAAWHCVLPVIINDALSGYRGLVRVTLRLTLTDKRKQKIGGVRKIRETYFSSLLSPFPLTKAEALIASLSFQKSFLVAFDG